MAADSDRAATFLAQARERAAGADRAFTFGNFGEAAARSQRDVPPLLAAVEAVLAIHESVRIAGVRVCMYCLDPYGEHVEWPCAEYRAISAALPGEEADRA